MDARRGSRPDDEGLCDSGPCEDGFVLIASFGTASGLLWHVSGEFFTCWLESSHEGLQMPGSGSREGASDRVGAAVAGADADRLVDVRDEDLAVADAPGARGILDCFDDVFDESVFDHHLHLHLGQEVDHVFGAAVKLRMALLPPESLDLGDGDSGNADFVQRVLHIVELKWLDDRFDLLHARALIRMADPLTPNPRRIWKAGARP